MALKVFKNKGETNAIPINANNLNYNFTEILNLLYPVGHIIIRSNNKDYSDYLGFTWQRTAIGKMIVGYDPTDSDFNTVGKTGGEKTHKHLTQSGIVGTDSEKYLYGILDDVGLPKYGSEIIPNVRRATFTPLDVSDNNPVRVAYTKEEKSLPPHQVFAIWERIE